MTDLVRPTAEDAATAAKDLATATGADRHDVAVVLGSGWAPAADALGTPAAEVRVGELTGFAAPTAEGHGGTLTLESRRGASGCIATSSSVGRSSTPYAAA